MMKHVMDSEDDTGSEPTEGADVRGGEPGRVFLEMDDVEVPAAGHPAQEMPVAPGVVGQPGPDPAHGGPERAPGDQGREDAVDRVSRRLMDGVEVRARDE